MKKILLATLILTYPLIAISQTPNGGGFGINFSGYVKNDFFYDTRQTVNIREGHFLLYPLPESFDANKVDINSEPSLNFLSIQTRLTGNITAPDAFGAKINGVIEADFFGNENAAFVDANGFRLRHAFAKMTWSTTELLFGQYWHPLFVPSNFSDVISFNTGAPFQPFSRNPQIRITQKFGPVSVFGATLMQRDFTSPGGSLSLRNSALPELQAQVQYNTKTDGREFLAGAGGGYKWLRPLLFTEKTDSLGTRRYFTDEKVGSFSSTAFIKYSFPSLTLKLQGIYGQNLFDMTMMGGYGISEIDQTTNKVKYSPFNTLAIWAEAITNYKSFQFALWGGYTEIMGADERILLYTNKVGGGDATLRGTSADGNSAIKSIYRIAPRVVWTSGKLNLALEFEYTNAAYAQKDQNGRPLRDEFGKITSTKDISNLRTLFSVILKF